MTLVKGETRLSARARIDRRVRAEIQNGKKKKTKRERRDNSRFADVERNSVSNDWMTGSRTPSPNLIVRLASRIADSPPRPATEIPRLTVNRRR